MNKTLAIIFALVINISAQADLVPYLFTGYLRANLPQDVPTNASPELLAVTNNDIFYLSFTLDTGAHAGPFINYWKHAAKNITFSVPARGLVYTAAAEDLEVLQNTTNPATLRWDVTGVDTNVNMTFLCEDSSMTALTSTNVPDPLNLTGFHMNGFAQILLFNATGQNAELFYGNLAPVPFLNLAQQGRTNVISWITSDLTYTPALQQSGSLATSSGWQAITNAPVITGLTNKVTLPPTNNATGFFRLRIL